jgi:excisionase family DNA binding protein
MKPGEAIDFAAGSEYLKLPTALSDTGAPANAIKQLLAAGLTNCRRLLADTEQPVLRRVHEVRKMSKRLRATVRLLRGAIAGDVYREINRGLRDISRDLAPYRDAEVRWQTWRRLFSNSDIAAGTRPWTEVEAVLAAASGKLMLQLQDHPESLLDIDFSLRFLQHRLALFPMHGNDFAAIGNGLTRIYRRAYRIINSELKATDSERLHDWRKQVKYLLHQYEILHFLHPQLLSLQITTLRRLASLVGDNHDHEVLRQHLRDNAQLPANLWPHADTRLAQRAQQLGEEAIVLGRTFFTDKPSGVAHRFARLWYLHATTDNRQREVIRTFIGKRVSSDVTGQWLSTRTAAEKCGISPGKLRYLIRRQKIGAIKLADRYLIHASEVAAFYRSKE